MAKRGCLSKLFIGIIVVGLLSCGLLFGLGYLQYKTAITEKPIETAVTEVENNESYVAYENISPYYLKAVVAVEDKRFYQHGAMDPIGFVRALLIDIKKWDFSEGGSTITQQVAKNLYFSNEKRVTRKIAEAFVAHDLEKKYSKDEILAMYSNIIYFGQGCYGVKEASEKYFNKEPSALTFEEAAVLAGIPKAPSILNPINNPEKSSERTKAVLKILEENGIAP